MELDAAAPAEFPTVRLEKTRFTVSLTPIGTTHVLIHASQTGWKDGEEWDRAFAALANANAEWLNWLHQSFVSGPIDWSKMDFGKTPAQ